MIICLLCSILLVFSMLSVFTISINAGGWEPSVDKISGDFGYSYLSDGTIEISLYYGNANNLLIPSEIDGYKVSSIGVYAFTRCSSLVNVVIPNYVTNIGYGAFCNCKNLTSVDTGTGVTSIGTEAFQYCSNLMSINLSNKLSTIGQSAFESCSILSDITIPNSVTNIGIAAFRSTGFTRITIPNSVTSIRTGTFYYCRNLTCIDIPRSVTSIGIEAFAGCISLTNVKIPDSVTEISADAFEGCNNLTSIIIPRSVTKINSYAFGFNAYWDDVEEDIVHERYDDFTIYGYAGTAAETYAKENYFTFIALNDNPQPTLGDADGDGEITTIDVTNIQRYCALLKTNIDEEILIYADVDGDGVLSIIDATYIQRYLAHIEIPFRIGEPKS